MERQTTVGRVNLLEGGQRSMVSLGDGLLNVADLKKQGERWVWGFLRSSRRRHAPLPCVVVSVESLVLSCAALVVVLHRPSLLSNKPQKSAW